MAPLAGSQSGPKWQDCIFFRPKQDGVCQSAREPAGMDIRGGGAPHLHPPEPPPPQKKTITTVDDLRFMECGTPKPEPTRRPRGTWTPNVRTSENGVFGIGTRCKVKKCNQPLYTQPHHHHEILRQYAIKSGGSAPNPPPPKVLLCPPPLYRMKPPVENRDVLGSRQNARPKP